MGGTRPPIEIERPPIEILALVCGRKKLVFFWGRSSVFGRKNHLNFRFWQEKAFGFRRRHFFCFFFLEITCIWREKPLKLLISARKSPQISAKTFSFFFWRSPNFHLKIASIQVSNNENLGQVRLRNKLSKNPGYVPVVH